VSDGGPPRFFHEEEPIPGASVALSDDETAHAGQSLRLKPGDPVELVDGRGHVARARVAVARRREFAVEVIETTFTPRADRAPLVMGIGLLKGPRFDTALEKLTELGADVLVPLAARHVEALPKGEARSERWRRLVVAAMKQSRRAWLPELREPVSPAALLAGEAFGAVWVAHLGVPAGRDVAPSRVPAGGTRMGDRSPVPAAPELLAVGPEGGWSQDELELFGRHGASFISLGPNRLRGETAAIALLCWRLAALGAFGAGREGIRSPS
jgi:16S rRNA (uracil1498-N3)-methyltransferase